MKYRLAIFDFDGTLADSFPWFQQAFREIGARHRFRHLDDSQLESLRGCSARQVLAALEVPAWRLPLIARDFRRLMEQDLDQIALFPGVDALLSRLAEEGVTLSVVTSNSLPNVLRVLGPENAARIRYFSCGASIFGKRPRLRQVVRASGVRAGEALCIGDELRDLEAARAEGIPFGAVGWGYTRLEALVERSPDVVFRGMDEILTALGVPGAD